METIVEDYFEKLPTEILEKIFCYLNADKDPISKKKICHLKNAALVCKRWNGIIWKSSKIMSRMELSISKDLFDDFLNSMEPRHYQNMYLNKTSQAVKNKPEESFDDFLMEWIHYQNNASPEEDISEEKILHFLEIYGPNIRKLNFWEMSDYTNVTKLCLLYCPNLKRLIFGFRDLLSRRNSERNLNFNRLRVWDLDLLEMLKNFHLEHLYISETDEMNFTLPICTNWKLETLEIDEDINGKANENSLIAFLESQKLYMKSLKAKITPNILNHIMSNMNQLTEMKIFFDEEFTHSFSNHQWNEISHLKDLHIYNRYENGNRTTVEILKYCPNVEFLYVDCICSEFAETVPLINLNWLVTDCMYLGAKIMDLVKFPNLVSLTVYSMCEIVNITKLKRIIKYFPQLYYLEIPKYNWSIKKEPRDVLREMNVHNLSIDLLDDF